MTTELFQGDTGSFERLLDQHFDASTDPQYWLEQIQAALFAFFIDATPVEEPVDLDMLIQRNLMMQHMVFRAKKGLKNEREQKN